VGTFSKILFSSPRLGYVILPETLVEPFVALRWLTDFQSFSLQQSAMALWMTEGHHQQHIRRIRKIYNQRRNNLVDSLHRRFPAGDFNLSGDNAGLHILVWLNTIKASQQNQLMTACQIRLVGIFPVDIKGDENEQCGLTLGFIAITENDIDEGIK